MEEYRFKGKTIEELEEELDKAEGVDENGNPNWWQALANLEDAHAFKGLMETIKEYGRKSL